MAMTNVDISVRPIKIAFLIDYNDKKSLIRAISINSVLWGGRYNPIIPVYKRLPPILKEDNAYILDTKENILTGYIETFDADYIVNFSSLKDKVLPVPAWRIIKEQDIFDNSVKRRGNDSGEVNYGTGIFEILDYVEDQEFKYVRNRKVDVWDYTFNKRGELFFGSVFGLYTEKVRAELQKRYKDTLPIKTQQVRSNNYIQILKERPITIRGLCNSYLEVLGNRDPRDSYVFLLDAYNWQDIVDYINLRALGVRVIALPLHLLGKQETRELAEEFINRNYRKYNDNNVYYSTSLLRARNCPEEQMKIFADSLYIKQEKGEHKWVYQTWYPRIWDGWQSDRSGLTSIYLEHKQASHDASDSDEISVPQSRPDFINDYNHFWKPKYANDIRVRSYGSDDFYANAFPTNVDFANQVLGKFASYDEWRFSRRGIVYLPQYPTNKIDFKLPSAENLYDQWQQTKKIKAVTSPPGKLARQIVKKMGVDHLNILAVEGFAKLIQRLSNSKGTVQSISHEHLWGQIQKFTNKSIWISPDNFFKWLLHKRVCELGVDITCENCGSSTWHALENVRTYIICSVCAEKIDLGLTDPRKQIIWSYRPSGPFMVPDLSKGAYTVALALNFFANTMKMNITPRYSFNSKDGRYEADLGILIEPKWYWYGGLAYVIGECKSFGYKNRAQFKTDEIAKLLRLGKKHTNSTLLFATLSRILTPTDKSRLTKLVNKLREDRFNGKDAPNVLILTGNELFAERTLKKTWEEVGDKHKEFSERSSYYSLQELCHATQELYLDVEDYWMWWDKKHKAIQNAKKAEKTT